MLTHGEALPCTPLKGYRPLKSLFLVDVFTLIVSYINQAQRGFTWSRLNLP